MHSLYWNATKKKHHHHLQSLVITSICSFIRSALSLPQSSLRKGGGHVVGGVYPRRAEWRTAPVPRRERDRSGDHNSGRRESFPRASCGSLAPEGNSSLSQFDNCVKTKSQLQIVGPDREVLVFALIDAIDPIWSHASNDSKICCFVYFSVMLRLTRAFMHSCRRLLRVRALSDAKRRRGWDSYSWITMVPVSTLTNPTSMKLLCHRAAFGLQKSQFLIHPSAGRPVNCYWASHASQF